VIIGLNPLKRLLLATSDRDRYTEFEQELKKSEITAYEKRIDNLKAELEDLRRRISPDK